MKSTKTILAVALLIVGFSYVTYAYPPGLQTVPSLEPPWDYWSGVVQQGGNTNPIFGAGFLHGVWLVPPSSNGFTRVDLWDGDPDDGGVQISVALISVVLNGAIGPQFVQLDVAFENGIFLGPSGLGSPLITILYKQ